MSLQDHYEGFEKERKFHLILGQAISDCPTLKARSYCHENYSPHRRGFCERLIRDTPM